MIQLFQNVLKGESVKRGGGKTSGLLGNQLLGMNIGNVEDVFICDATQVNEADVVH